MAFHTHNSGFTPDFKFPEAIQISNGKRVLFVSICVHFLFRKTGIFHPFPLKYLRNITRFFAFQSFRKMYPPLLPTDLFSTGPFAERHQVGQAEHSIQISGRLAQGPQNIAHPAGFAPIEAH